MKLGRQGELLVEKGGSYIAFVSKPTEVNVRGEEKKPFTGEIKVQPHFVKSIWEVLEGKKEKAVIRSGENLLVVKWQPEKERVRVIFGNKGEESSYLLFGTALSRFKDLFLRAIRESGVSSVRNGKFSAVKAGEFVVVRNDAKEVYLDKAMRGKLKKLILENYLEKTPVKMEGRGFKIDENHNLIFKGIIIPKEHVRDLYLFVL